MFCRILVPLDGSPIAERGLPLAAALAQRSGGMLILVRVVPRDASTTYVTSGDDYLHSRVAELQATNLHVISQELFGEPAVAIAAATREHVADLVVMATHAREGLSRLLFGSVTSSVLHDGDVPVVAVPPRATRVQSMQQGGGVDHVSAS